MSNSMMRCGVLAAVFLVPGAVFSQEFSPEFRVQTELLAVSFAGETAATVAFAGRGQDGEPMLGLLGQRDGAIRLRELDLPDGAVAIDIGAASADAERLFVLGSGAVYSLNGFDAELQKLADVTSVYRGRSYAELSSDLDFARDLDGDGVADLLVPDFDELHVVSGDDRRSIELPAYRRGYEQTVAYRAPTFAVAPGVDGGTIYSMRGNTLLGFAPAATAASARLLALGLSDELAQENFYNSYEDIDQNDVVLRELDRFTDVNNDGHPDIVTLETVSEGVFDKTTTYRIHHGVVRAGTLDFAGEADTVLSSRGFQIGAQIESLDDTRNIMVTASVQVGVRAIIGALFSRSVTMRVEIHPPAPAGGIASEPGTVIKARVKFDFSTGQAEFPTIAFGDIDGDGVNDLVLKERNRDLRWRKGKTDGSFIARSVDLAAVGPADGTDVALVDINGDGRDEPVVLYGRADGKDLAGRLAVFTAPADTT